MGADSSKRAIDQGNMAPSSKSLKGVVYMNETEITNVVPPGADHTRDGLEGIPATKSKKQR